MAKIQLEINHEDERGVIIDLLENEVVNAVTYITLAKDAIRGNHYHKETTQWNYITKGRVKILSQSGDKPVVEILAEKGDLYITPPMEKHAFVGIEESEMLVFTKGPRGGKEYESDTFRLEQPLI